jgi:electron transport complex protein RnfD
MTKADGGEKKETSDSSPTPLGIRVAPSPHLSDSGSTTRRIMLDVLIGLLPVLAVSIFVFHWYAVVQVGLCVLCCMATEAVCAWMRRRPVPLDDYSAAITGVILGLSLPWSAPWYVGVIGSVTAIGLGKVVFGGLGYNIFNPAMVGRAFVMLSFARELGASAFVAGESKLDVLTGATPLSLAKHDLPLPDLWPMLVGTVNGSLGETSAIALLVGGLYLVLRRVIAWEIPLGIIVAVALFGGLGHIADITTLGPLQHLINGALLLGAFFIATDPVTSPMTPRGKLAFGVGIGLLIVVIRLFSGYPEGVMFAVLVMNSAVPLINRWTIPRPLGMPSKQDMKKS